MECAEQGRGGVTKLTKAELLVAGIARAAAWCERNEIVMPAVSDVLRAEWRINGACAYYRSSTIFICPALCAAPGVAGRAWSWPGYSVDRTPYGVVAHELGHYVDMLRSKDRDRYRGDFSASLRANAGELPLTSYCPDDGEWFAEIFRLFVTNPDLLCQIRPATYGLLISYFQPLADGTWDWVLRNHGAPERTLSAARNKVTLAAARQLQKAFQL